MYQNERQGSSYDNQRGMSNQEYGYQGEYSQNNYEQETEEPWQINNQQQMGQPRQNRVQDDYSYNQNRFNSPPQQNNREYGDGQYNQQGRRQIQNTRQHPQHNQPNYRSNNQTNMDQNRQSNFQPNNLPSIRQQQNNPPDFHQNNRTNFQPSSPTRPNAMQNKPSNPPPTFQNQSNFRSNNSQPNIRPNMPNSVRHSNPINLPQSSSQNVNPNNQSNYRPNNNQQNLRNNAQTLYNNSPNVQTNQQQNQWQNQNPPEQKNKPPGQQSSVVAHSQHSGGAVFGVVVKQPNTGSRNEPTTGRSNNQSYPQQNQIYNRQDDNNYNPNNQMQDHRNYSKNTGPRDNYNTPSYQDDLPPPPPNPEQYYNNSPYQENYNQQTDNWRPPSPPQLPPQDPIPPPDARYQYDRNDNQYQDHVKQDDYRPYRSAPDNNQPQRSPVSPVYPQSNNRQPPPDHFNYSLQNNVPDKQLNQPHSAPSYNNEYQLRGQNQRTPTSPGSYNNFPQGSQPNRQYSPDRQPQRNYSPDRQYNSNYSHSQPPTAAPKSSVEIPKPQNVKSVKNMFERKGNNAPPLFPKNNIRPVPPRPQINKNQPQNNSYSNNQNQNSGYYQSQDQYTNSPNQPYQPDYQNQNTQPQQNNYQADNRYDDRQEVLNNARPLPPASSNYQPNSRNVPPQQNIRSPPNRDLQNDGYNQNLYQEGYNVNKANNNQMYNNPRQNNQMPNQYNDGSRYNQENRNEGNIPTAGDNQMQYNTGFQVQQQSYSSQLGINRTLDDNREPYQQSSTNQATPSNERKYVDVRNLINSKPINTQAQGNQQHQWNQAYNNRGSRTSFTEDQRRYDRGNRGSVGGYSDNNPSSNMQTSPQSSYKKPQPPQKFYSKSMNNLDQVQDKPHIEIESYEESSLNNESKFSTSPNLKPMVVAVAFHDEGFDNQPNNQYNDNSFQVQGATTGNVNQQQYKQSNQRVTFTESTKPAETYLPRAVATLTVEDNNDNSSEVSNYVPSVVSRSYNAFGTDANVSQQPQYTQQQNHNLRQPEPSKQQPPPDQRQYNQQPDQPVYSQSTQYTVQNTVREGIPTPPRTDRQPQQRKNYFQESAPKPIVTRQPSDENKQQRQPYANDENWRVLTPPIVNQTPSNNLQNKPNARVSNYQHPAPPTTTPPDYDDDDSSDEIDVDAPTPPLTQNPNPFFRNTQQTGSNNFYEQNRPKRILKQDNEVPKGYRPAHLNVTKVKPPLKIDNQQPMKPQRNSGKPLSPLQPTQQKDIISEEDSGIFEDKNGSTLSNVSSRDKISLGKSGAMGRRKPPTRIPSSQNIMEDVNDDFQIEVTPKDLQNRAKSIEVHREQSMKEIRKKEAMRKIILEKQHNERKEVEDHVDEGVQTEFSGYNAAVSAPYHDKSSTKLVFKVPQKTIPQKDPKEIPIVTYEEPKDSKKQPKYDDLLGQFKTARDSALKSAHLKQSGALKAVSGLVKMSKKKEPEPTHKRIPRPEKNLHVVQRAQLHSQEVKPSKDSPPRERRVSPEKGRSHEYDKVEDRPTRLIDKGRDGSDRDRRNYKQEPDRHPSDRDSREKDRVSKERESREKRRDDDRGRYDDRRDRRNDDRDRQRDDRQRYREDFDRDRRVSPPRSPRRDAYDDYKARNVRHSPQKREVHRREPSRERRLDYDDDYRRDRRSPPRRNDYDPRDREPDWVQQFRQNRGPDSRGSGSESSRVAKRAWVNDPRRKERSNRELDMDEFEREVRAATSYNSDFEQPARPRHQVMPTKLMAKKPPPRKGNDDWMLALKQKNRVAERHRYRK